jgi:hypothetical protein
MRLDILQIVYSSFDTLQVVNCCVSFTYTWNDSVLPNPSVIFKLIQHLSVGSITSMLAGGLGPVNGWLSLITSGSIEAITELSGYFSGI